MTPRPSRLPHTCSVSTTYWTRSSGTCSYSHLRALIPTLWQLVYGALPSILTRSDALMITLSNGTGLD